MAEGTVSPGRARLFVRFVSAMIAIEKTVFIIIESHVTLVNDRARMIENLDKQDHDQSLPPFPWARLNW